MAKKERSVKKMLLTEARKNKKPLGPLINLPRDRVKMELKRRRKMNQLET